MAVFTVAFCLVGSASAQITINLGDLPQAIGDSFRYKYVQNSGTVNNGTPGGPQTWTFDTSTYVGYVLTSTVVDPAATPYRPWFPDANYATREPRGMYTLFVYDRLESSGLSQCGYAAQFGGGDMVAVNTPPFVQFEFPGVMGNSWLATYSVTDTVSDTVLVAAYHTQCSVDAWGTANTPLGSLACLRGNYVGLVVTTRYVGGNPIGVDTSLTRRYMWFAKGAGTIAMTHSMERDTSPDFTLADDIMVLVQTNASAIRESQQSEVRPVLTVRPNPCQDRVRVECALDRPGPVAICLFDAAGRTVSRRNAMPTASRVVLPLDLRGLSSGVYAVKLSAAGFTSTHKLVIQAP